MTHSNRSSKLSRQKHVPHTHTSLSILMSSKPQCFSLIMVQLLLSPSYSSIKISLQSTECLPVLGPSVSLCIHHCKNLQASVPLLFFLIHTTFMKYACSKAAWVPMTFREKKVHVYSKFSTADINLPPHHIPHCLPGKALVSHFTP